MALILAWRRAAVTAVINVPTRGFKRVDDSYVIEDYRNVIFPPGTERKLPAVPKMPIFYDGEMPQKTGRRDIEMRGPELVHTELIHKQYGIMAADGGEMKWDHFEAVRKHVNHHIEKSGEENAFGIWRLAYPWLPRTPRSRGKKRGGGKGKIAHFVTPVKHGRLILELGGYITEAYAYRILIKAAKMMPVKSRFVSYEMLLKEKEEEERIKKENMNKFTLEFIMKYNMQGAASWFSQYDYVWGGKHR